MDKIWLNAFKCVSPSDEFAAEVGREVIRKLVESQPEEREGEIITPWRRVQLEITAS